MKRIIICILCLTTSGILFGQDQPKNLVGISAGIVPFGDAYFDMPINAWPDRESSPVGQVFYARQVSEVFRIGSYLEYENAKFNNSSTKIIYSFSRYNLGINWLGQFPKTSWHMQLGGYFGYGFLIAKDWDNLKGVDLGLIIGPAYEKNKFGMALHMQGGHAWYGSSGTPEGVMLYYPKFLLKFYYKL